MQRSKGPKSLSNDLFVWQNQCNALLKYIDIILIKHNTIILVIVRILTLVILLIYFYLYHEEYVMS